MVALVGKEGVLVTRKLAGVAGKIAESLDTQSNSLHSSTPRIGDVEVIESNKHISELGESCDQGTDWVSFAEDEMRMVAPASLLPASVELRALAKVTVFAV